MFDYYQHGIGESGWGSINNLLFPGSAPVSIRSELTAPAGGTGQTSRYTPPENPSMIETFSYYNQGVPWLGSPYEANMAVPAKVQESKQMAAIVEPKKDPLGGSLDWAIETSVKAATLYDQIKSAFGKREVISETPRAGYSEGQDVSHTNDLQSRSAEVVSSGKALVNQIKGLFNLGYPQTEPQPAAGVEHEIEPKETPFKVPVIAIIIILMILVYK